MAKSPLEEILEETKKELSVDRQSLNSHMQAITNGYSIATTLMAKTIEVSRGYDIDAFATELNTLAGKIGASIYRDYLQALKEATNESKT